MGGIMKKLVIVIFALLFAVTFISGCVVHKTEKTKEKVIIVPAKKKGKVAICHKGKTKFVKKNKVDKYLKKGAKLGTCR